MKRPSPEECRAMNRFCASFNCRRASRSVTRYYDRFLRPAGVSATQFPILAALAADDGESLTSLTEILDLDRSTLSRNVALLARKGLVATSPSSGPRPGNVRLTRKGEQVLGRAYEGWLEAQRRLVATIEPGELDRALTVLQRLEQAVAAAERAS